MLWKERYNKLKEQGLCTSCGKHKVALGLKRDKTSLCKKCLITKRLRGQKSREKKFPQKKLLREEKEKAALRIQKELEKM